MRIVAAADVEAAETGHLLIGRGDLVTPLARERAADLGVTIEIGLTNADVGNDPAAAQARPEPPSGALYRRGAPVVTARVRVDGLGQGASPARRATVVGAGHVGATTALALAEADVFGEVVLVDIVPGLAAGIALDLTHAAPLMGFATRLRGAVDLADAGPSDYVVITAGRARQPGMSRADLMTTNATIVAEVATAVRGSSPDAVVVVVTNPLDEMTHLAQAVTGFSPRRVLGMAGVLDAARFEALAAEASGERPEAVSALALGSHGDEMVIPLSQARIRGEAIERRLDRSTLDALVERTRGAGAEVVGLLPTGSAYYAPAAAVARMVLAMAGNTGEVLPVCVRADGSYDITDVYVGMPARLDAGGVSEIVELALRPDELDGLRLAARRISERLTGLSEALPAGV
jgi:malate dehydrogenase